MPFVLVLQVRVPPASQGHCEIAFYWKGCSDLMVTIQKRPGRNGAARYRVQVRLQGHTLSPTYAARAAARRGRPRWKAVFSASTEPPALPASPAPGTISHNYPL